MSQYLNVSTSHPEAPQPVTPHSRPRPSLGQCLMIGSGDGVIETLLLGAGFGIETAETLDEVVAQMAVSEPDFVILDVAGCGRSGIAICRAIRTRHETPIVVLGDGIGTDMEHAFAAGADAYLSQPVRHHELVARVRALLRRRPAIVRTGPPDSVDEVRVDRKALVAMVSGRPLELSAREFEVLATLIADCGIRVTRREALLSIDESSHALDAVIRRVRSLLEAEEGWRRLVSVRGVGFTLLRSRLDNAQAVPSSRDA